MTLDDRSFTIVGVAPPGFWFTQAADAYVPLRPSGSMSDNGFNTGMIARLKPGIPVRRANAEMPAVMENFRRAHPDPNAVKDRAILLTPFQESLTDNVRTTLWLLLGAVALLLLIACSNLGSLLLARLSARQKEMAVRLALRERRRATATAVPRREHAARDGRQRGRISGGLLVVRRSARAGSAGSAVIRSDSSRSSGAWRLPR